MKNIKVDKFIETVLKGQEIPGDLNQWIIEEECCAELLEEMECQLLEPEEIPDLISHSYLNENDRNNPDIMANVAAIDEVFKFITFVAKSINGNLVGYWHGPENVPIIDAPIVRYDTEGQFSLLSGKNITEALIGDYVFDEDDEFIEFRNAFKQCGIQMESSNFDELHEPKPLTSPDSLHNDIYNKNRKKAGLTKI
jgi:hypothetical protein